MPPRFEPALWTFVVAIAASLLLHLGGAGAVEKFAGEISRVSVERSAPVEIEFDVQEQPLEDKDAEPEQMPEQETTRARRKNPKKPPSPEQAEPEKKKEELVEAIPAASKEIKLEDKIAVEQKSDDPSVQAPDDAKFLAEENRQVEEQSVARVRNQVKDDPGTELGGPLEKTPAETELSGNAAENEVREEQDVKGQDDGRLDPGRSKLAEESGQAVPSQQSAGAKTPVAENKEVPQVAFADKSGVIWRIPKRASKKIPLGLPGGPKMKWSDYEGAVGKEEAKRSRLASARAHTKVRGARNKRWKKFRSAIENYVPNVKPGNQTALNSRAAPFAAYLAGVHRLIHRQFAHSFLPSLPAGGGHPFADESLVTRLEIVFKKTGELDKVGVTRTSGFTPFDFGAFDSVQSAGPYPKPPASIVSYDGKVYMTWDFYRNSRQCGTFNANLHILAAPKTGPVDRGEHG